MSDRKTQVAPNTFKKSVGAGFQSLVGAKGRTFFVLEVKKPTSKYKAGQKFTFTSDYIEMGRGSKSALSFSPESKYVSRRHAAIQKEGQNYVIKNLSQTNPTLVNGQPVANQWHLKNGDEIQLAMEGPILGFNTPPNNTARSLPLSIRLQAFRREALRPYKAAVMALFILFISSVSIGAYFIDDLGKKNEQMVGIINQQKDDLKKSELSRLADKKKHEEDIALIEKNNKKADREFSKRLASQTAAYQAELAKIEQRNQDRINAFKAEQDKKFKAMEGSASLVTAFENDVYLIIGMGIECHSSQVGPEVLNKINSITNRMQWTGTGFILEDGKFVTAKHVSHPWFYWTDTYYPTESGEYLPDPTYFANVFLNNFPGASITTKYKIISPSGKEEIISSTQFKIQQKGVEKYSLHDPIFGEEVVVSKCPLDGSDWAFIPNINIDGKIKVDNSASTSLTGTEKVYVLGYPLVSELNDINNLKISFSESTVAQKGLDKGGYIQLSNKGFDSGNSGGPAFIINDKGEAVVIGIVSAGISEFGLLTPIVNAK